MSGADLWAAGDVRIPRALYRSDLWRTLTLDQRAVVHALYLLANYKTDRLASGIEVHRGQLAHGLRRIAEEAKVSIKVVRTTLRILSAGSEREGVGPLISVPQGTEEGTGPRILTLRYYARSTVTVDDAGTASGTGSGTPGARGGHAEGTERRKEAEERMEGATTAPLFAPRVSAPSKSIDEKRESTGTDRAPPLDHKAIWEMLERVFLEVRGRAYSRSAGQDAAAVKRIRGYSDATMGEVELRWRRGLVAAGWLRCETFADLATHKRWNQLADATAGRRLGAAVPVGDWAPDMVSGPVDVHAGERKE